MAQPSEKSPEMNKLLDGMSKSVFKRIRVQSILSDECVSCGKPAVEFKDNISRKEFTISGMCQTCQDEVFGGV